MASADLRRWRQRPKNRANQQRRSSEDIIYRPNSGQVALPTLKNEKNRPS
ncbi:MAG UNVERIFIED_CONTAM: hypothetical protein LVR29_19090 [Microcystis novacekii LVE1205-3]|jgi:hypothetical protein